MDSISKDGIYSDALSSLTESLSQLVTQPHSTSAWDSEKLVLWGWTDEEAPNFDSNETSFQMAASAELVGTGKHRPDNGLRSALSAESENDPSAVNGSPFTRYGSAPGRIAESSIDRTSDENEELVNSSGYTPRDKGQAAATPLRESGLSMSGRQSPNGRSLTNGSSPTGGRPSSLQSTPRSNGQSDKSLNSSQNKKRSGNWFSLSYKQKSEEFHKLFKNIPSDERLLVDYSCAMQKDLLVQGRVYISQNSICFYASIFKWETVVTIPCKDIISITKEKTARVIPNAIQINTANDKYFFSSFTSRDKTYLMMFRVWQNVLLQQPMTNAQLWQWVHQLNGSQLGFTASDSDYDLQDSAQDSDNIQTPDTTQTPKAGEPKLDSRLSTVYSATNGGMAADSDVPVVADGPPFHEISTDYTDNTDNEDVDVGEVECPEGHDHTDWITLDLTVNYSVDQLFKLLFSDNDFMRAFLAETGSTDLVLGQWSDEPDSEGIKHRKLHFTIAINASFGPKSTPASQTQKQLKECVPGLFYCIDCESINDPSLPYGENFHVWNRYCIRRVTKSTSRVTVRTKIVYTKSIFALAKAIIDKNVRNGVNDYFRPLNIKLVEESEKLAASSQQEQPHKKKRYTKHRAPSTSQHRVVTCQSNGSVPGINRSSSTAAKTADDKTSSPSSYTVASTVRVMSVLLIFLVTFNLLLFWKLISLETKHEAMQLENLSKHSDFYTHQDIVDLLNKQKYLYEKDITRWKTTLDSSKQVIEELRHSISTLKAQQQSGERVEQVLEADQIHRPNKELKTDL